MAQLPALNILGVFSWQDRRNAEYLEEAMGIHPPHPTRRLDFCSNAELQLFIDDLRVSYPQYFEVDAFCAEPLGFYLFRKYCRQEGSEMYADFINDIAIFRGASSKVRKSIAARVIYYYLLDGSRGTAGRRSSVLLEDYAGRVLPPDTPASDDAVDDPASMNWLRVSGESLGRIFAESQVPKTPLEWEALGLEDSTALSDVEITPTFFDSLDLSVFKHLKDLHYGGFRESEMCALFFRLMERGTRGSTIDDFVFLRTLGRGGFGIVKAAKSKETGKMFAVKVMSKVRIKFLDSPDLVLEERKVMTMVNSPYVVCLKYAFSTPTDLYLVLDLMTGGDLGYHLGKRGAFPGEECRYYAARIVKGIKALHDLDIVYRDLKPENILLNEHGYSRISDFGLACRMSKSGLSEACGTRGYWAPEMLRRDEDGLKERYFLQVDWFSLGCIVYEFHAGVGPFRTERARKWGGADLSKDQVMDCATREMDVEFDERFDPEAADLVSRLLSKDPATRLGAKGAAEVMSHPYFGSIDFPHLELMIPPYKPPKNINTVALKDIGKFQNSDVKGITWDESEDAQYEGWAFTNVLHFQHEAVGFMRFEDVLGKTIEPVNLNPRNTCRQS